MAIWTNGTDLVLATGWGIARRSGAATSVMRYSLSGLRRDQDPPEVVSLVVLDQEGKRALVQRRGEPPAVWTHAAGGGRVTPCAVSNVVGVAAAPGGRMAVLVTEPTGEGWARMVLRSAEVDGEELRLGDEIALPEAPRLTWANSMMKDGEGWPEKPSKARGEEDDDDDDDDDDETEGPAFDPRALSRGPADKAQGWWPGTVQLSANRFGVGVSSTYGGIVAVLDPRTLAPRVVARVPSRREQFDVFVLPLAAGMLVTLVANGRHTEFVYVDDGAAVRGNRIEFGKDLAWGSTSPGVAWDGATALVSQMLTDEEMYALTVPTMKVKRFTEDPGYLADAGSTADGAVHVLARTLRGYARPKNWQLSRWTKKGARWSATEVEMPDFSPPAPPPAPVGPERMTGTPALGAVAVPATAWRARAGEEVMLRVRVENRGGPARGLYVELGGAAIGEGCVSAQGVAIAGSAAPASFVRKGAVARAELAEDALEAGFVVPLRGKSEGIPVPPPPSITVELRVRAERAGQALLSVRVGPRGATGTSGSGMVGRSFVVEAG